MRNARTKIIQIRQYIFYLVFINIVEILTHSKGAQNFVLYVNYVFRSKICLHVSYWGYVKENIVGIFLSLVEILNAKWIFLFMGLLIILTRGHKVFHVSFNVKRISRIFLKHNLHTAYGISTCY